MEYYIYTITQRNREKSKCFDVRTSNVTESLRLLGMSNSIRFIEKWEEIGLPKKEGNIFSQIVNIEELGSENLIGMQTSTSTFIAEGLVSHNSYPPTYVDRILSMFPDAKRILHLFSGSVHQHITLDRREDLEPSIVGDAEHLPIANESFDLILADPPYTEEDANHYGTCLVNRNKVVEECWRILSYEGNLVWLDQVLPMYRKKDWDYWCTIGIVRSTNHRFRIVSIFKKHTHTLLDDLNE